MNEIRVQPIKYSTIRAYTATTYVELLGGFSAHSLRPFTPIFLFSFSRRVNDSYVLTIIQMSVPAPYLLVITHGNLRASFLLIQT